MLVKVIVATDTNNGIGKNNRIPWSCKDDMHFFARNTIGNGENAVMMGKNTWLSIGRPLVRRMNIVVSSTLSEIEGAVVSKTVEEGIEAARKAKVDILWVIGGAGIYEWFLNYEHTDEVVVSKIPGRYKCDVFFPAMNAEKWSKSYQFEIGKSGLTVFYYRNRLKWRDPYDVIV